MSTDSPHFRLEEVAPGAWAALAGDTGACVSNAGIIDLGDQTLVFDTFVTPTAGTDLRRAAERLTGRPVTLVVNSHHHGDHVRGNQAFSDASIISTERTAELINETSPGDFDAYATHLSGWIESLDQQLADGDSAGRPDVRSDLQSTRAMAQSVLTTLPELTITPPTTTFSDKLVVEGSERSVHLLSYGGGHSDSDTLVFLPDSGVLFAGDVLWVEHHPWAGDGHPDEWVGTIYRLKALAPSAVVPGHGTVADFEYARLFTRYLTFLCDMVKQAEATSTSVAKLAATPIPPQYAGWASGNRFRSSLEALGRRAGLPPD
ncbi:MAG: MBL fold metallo-hydrolase [Acidimicrobiia bacterium]|nr:MBL fold metallo-hydrolase [Acidimicrobiia bacterium]MBT8192560.1 MBL fold metallo-hydrolase [Acidimicrobiia bacterium]NNL13697.1 MBL fold metallo-hydrolase [Acidimicrobiia bacterium]